MGALRAAVGLALFAALAAGAAVQPPRELWGYVQVRSKAHIFWWLYYADSRTAGFAELPLILWLQGGPGSSGCGFGNFEEIGPLDKELKPRNTTWLQAASILFVDNPVGTGFSYVDDCSLFAKNLTTVVSDMMVFLNEFFTHRTEFQNVPFYIFSESYGGKMAAGIALELHKAVQEGSIKCNFAGVALGDSWISPLDSVLSWGPYLYSTSLLDDHGLAEVTAVAKEIMDAINKNEYGLATELWSKAEGIIEENTDNVNFYNIMTKEVPEMKANEQENFHLVRLYQRHVEVMHKNNLSELMNGPIRKKLKVIPDCVKWGGTFLSASVDLMSVLWPSTVLQSEGRYFIVVSSHIKFSLSSILKRGLTFTDENVTEQASGRQFWFYCFYLSLAKQLKVQGPKKILNSFMSLQSY